jgi:hypothetical protein
MHEPAPNAFAQTPSTPTSTDSAFMVLTSALGASFGFPATLVSSWVNR